MAGINFNLQIVTRNLNDIGKLQKEVEKFKQRATQSFKKTGQEVKQVNANVKVLNTGIGNIGNRLGFMAFQFTFMAGVAIRALQSVQQQLQQTVTEGAEAQDALTRAVLAADLDLTDQTDENIKHIKLMSDAIRDLGSGRTIFGTKEVANVFEQVGRALPNLTDKTKTVNATIGISNEVLKLMTVEQVNAKDAAIGFAKILANYKDKITDITTVTDTLVNVNRQSSAELDNLVNSFGFAAQKGDEMGLSIQELGALLGLVHDVTPQAGRAFTQLLREFSSSSTVFNKQLRNLGINITDNDGNFRNFVDVIKDVADVTKDLRSEFGDEGVLLFQDLFELDNNAARAFLAVVNNAERLDSLIAGASKSGSANALTAAIEQFSQKAKIDQLNNAINSLKVDFVIGLGPAIMEVTGALREMVRDKDVQEFFVLLGKSLSQELLPLMRLGVDMLKQLTKFLKNNEGAMFLLTKGVLILTGALLGLFILGTVGALAAVTAATIQRFLLPALYFLIPALKGVALASFLAFGALIALAFVAGAVAGNELGKLVFNNEEVRKVMIKLKQDIDGTTKAYNDWGANQKDVNNNLSQFIPSLESIDNAIKTWAVHAEINVVQFTEAFKKSFEELTGINIDEFFEGLSNNITTFFTTLPEKVESAVQTLIGTGRLIAARLWFGFLGFIRDVFDITGAIFDGSSLDLLFEKGREIGQKIWLGLQDTIGSIFDLLFGADDAVSFFENLQLQIDEFLADPIDKLNEWANNIGTASEETSTLSEEISSQASASMLNQDELDKLTQVYQGPMQTANKELKAGMDENKKELGFLDTAFEELRRAVKELEAKIRKTNVRFNKNDEGNVTGFTLTGGISKGEIDRLATQAFATGGIVTKPTNALIGEAGPEAVIPLDQLDKFGNGGPITIENNIVIEGNADSNTVDTLLEKLNDLMGDKVKGKSLMRSVRQ